MLPRFINVLKALRQLGILPLALYALYRLGLRTGYYKRAAIFDARFSNIELSNSADLFSLPSREQLLQIVGNDGKTALLKEADEIVAGKFRMFGGEPVELKLNGDWPLVHWTLFETGKIKLDGEIKFVWEPARFGWAFTLGRAYHLSGDDKYAEAFWKYFETFSEHNPPHLGPHWMNGQEVAIRLMAFVWADHVFAASPASGPARRGRLAESVAQHAARIPPTLIYARSQNNNHLVTEAAALYTAGLLFRNSKWRVLGWRWLNWAFKHQISGYGEYIQHSANYHRLMLQTAVWVNAIRSADFSPQNQWPHASAQALTRAAHWLFSMLDPVTGQTPNLGANDGSYIFPLSICSFADFRPVVQAAARAFLKTQMVAGVWDEMSVWLGLAPAAGAGVLPAEKTNEPAHYLADNLRGRNSWAYLRASRFRSRLSHMDQLHFDLWWRGLNVAQDAGTYLYNAEAPWDNPLVSTRVHNTVTVDGRDQMTRGDRFLTLDWFPAYSKISFERDENILQRVTAYYKGYRRLGVRHERTVTVYADERWQIEDKLITKSSSTHTYRLHWLLPDWEWKMQNIEQRVTIGLKSPQGWITLTLKAHPPLSNLSSLISVVRAGELLHGQRDVLPFEGWASPTYGVKIPALSLAVEVKSSQTARFTSEFIFPK